MYIYRAGFIPAFPVPDWYGNILSGDNFLIGTHWVLIELPLGTHWVIIEYSLCFQVLVYNRTANFAVIPCKELDYCEVCVACMSQE